MESHEKTIRQFFDNEYLDYAKYTLTNRALPSVVDGFKPAQRKIAQAASKLWKNGNEKPMKVFQLGGQAASMTFFHHGSLDDTIIGMTQDFKNSMPIFQGIGQFGSLRAPEAGAPRYVGVKLNGNFRLLYKDEDLTTPQYEEGELIEPEFFLPIIPTVLLNGGSGIAVGFSTNILNRDPVALIDACLECLQGKPIKTPLNPKFNGFKGEVVQTQPKTWVFKGKFEVKNTMQVEVTEIPPHFTFEKYEALLESLVEKGTLYSYEDMSSDGAQYLLKFPRATLAELISKNTLGSVLKLSQQETENLTTLDENRKLKVFERAEDIVQYFVQLRLGYYLKRKTRLLQDLDKDISDLTIREKFIDAVVSGSLVIQGVPKAEIVSGVTSLGIPASRTDSLISLPISSLTKEKSVELKKNIEKKKAEREEVEKTTPTEFYTRDLKDLRVSLVGKKSSPKKNTDQDILDFLTG